jgi:tetratricopeptide (TPR) repeat protein
MRPVWRRKWFWGLAAGLLLLGIVGGVWGLRRPFSGHVYDEVYAPPVIEGQMLGAGGQPAEGYRLYAQGAYHDALPKLLAVRSGDVAQDSAQFFAGICEMEMGQFPEAIQRLQALRARSGNEATTVLAKGIRWYLGLALWHEGEVDAALPFLRETADDAAAPQRAAARRVLQFIDP